MRIEGWTFRKAERNLATWMQQAGADIGAASPLRQLVRDRDGDAEQDAQRAPAVDRELETLHGRPRGRVSLCADSERTSNNLQTL